MTTLTTPQLVSISEAHRRGPGESWRVRLVWDGPNAQNISGASSKYWQATNDGTGTVEIRWGALGRKGQSKSGLTTNAALAKARSKLNSRSRSYIEDATTAPQKAALGRATRTRTRTTAKPAAKPQGAQRLPSVDLGGLLDQSALRGWILLDSDIDLSDRVPGCPTGNLYVDRRGAMFLVAAEADGTFTPYVIPTLIK